MSRERLFAAQFLTVAAFLLFFPRASLSDSAGGPDSDLNSSLSDADSNSISPSSAFDPAHAFTDRVRVGSFVVDATTGEASDDAGDIVGGTLTPATLALPGEQRTNGSATPALQAIIFLLMAAGLGVLLLRNRLATRLWTNRGPVFLERLGQLWLSSGHGFSLCIAALENRFLHAFSTLNGTVDFLGFRPIRRTPNRNAGWAGLQLHRKNRKELWASAREAILRNPLNQRIFRFCRDVNRAIFDFVRSKALPDFVRFSKECKLWRTELRRRLSVVPQLLRNAFSLPAAAKLLKATVDSSHAHSASAGRWPRVRKTFRVTALLTQSRRSSPAAKGGIIHR